MKTVRREQVSSWSKEKHASSQLVRGENTTPGNFTEPKALASNIKPSQPLLTAGYNSVLSSSLEQTRDGNGTLLL